MRLVSVVRTGLVRAGGASPVTVAVFLIAMVAVSTITALVQPTTANAADLPTMKRIVTKTVPCGTAENAKGVFAITSDPSGEACSTAIKVANKYLTKAQKSGPVDVKVGDYLWECQLEKQHGYSECLKFTNRTERVRLLR